MKFLGNIADYTLLDRKRSEDIIKKNLLEDKNKYIGYRDNQKDYIDRIEECNGLGMQRRENATRKMQ